MILNIDKPAGITSFGVVRKVRRWTGLKKVGHAGTLDPMATGVLLVCCGKATKQVPSLMNYKKVYEGCVELGTTRDTDDAEGKIIDQHPVPDISLNSIQSIVSGFKGQIDQVPPMYSALKVNGRPLYKLARQGVVLERAPRSVTIYNLDIVEWNSPFLTIRVTCSKGTYIRALARDIGEAAHTGGYLTSLRRLQVGPYQVDDAVTLSELEDELILDESISVH